MVRLFVKLNSPRRKPFVYCSVGATNYGQSWGEAGEKLRLRGINKGKMILIDTELPDRYLDSPMWPCDKDRKVIKNIITHKGDVCSEEFKWPIAHHADKIVMNFLNVDAPPISNAFLKSVPKKNCKITMRLYSTFENHGGIWGKRYQILIRNLHANGFTTELKKVENAKPIPGSPNSNIKKAIYKLVAIRGNPRKFEAEP